MNLNAIPKDSGKRGIVKDDIAMKMENVNELHVIGRAMNEEN